MATRSEGQFRRHKRARRDMTARQYLVDVLIKQEATLKAALKEIRAALKMVEEID